MRWDRLFSELEQSLADEARLEHEALADELRDEQWAATSWSAMLGGRVELELCGGARVHGPVELIGRDVVATDTTIVFRDAVVAVRNGQRAGSPRVSRLGWASAVRALADEEGPHLHVVRRDGSIVAGLLHVLGEDFLQLGEVMVPTKAVSCVSRRP